MKQIAIGILLLLSIKVYANESSVIKNLKQECSNGNSLACVQVGAKYQIKQKLNQAKVYYEKASALDFAYGYLMLGGIYDRQNDFKNASLVSFL